MRFNKLDLNLLVALDALLTERSVSRAAERLNLRPSATSNALARLRSYFDDELLVQVGRKMELTPRAEGLRDPVRDVLVRVDSAIAIQPEFVASTSERTFRIFTSDYTQAVFAPHLLALANEQRCSARFEFLPQISNPQRALERGEADLLIIPRGFNSPDHPDELLYREDFVCVVWRASHLARGELTLERYLAASHVEMRPSGTDTYSFESWSMSRRGVARRVAVTTYSFATMPGLVVGTDHVAMVHARLAQQAASALPLEIRPSPVEMNTMEQAVQWHKHRTQDPGLVWLRGMLRRAVQRMDSQSPAGTDVKETRAFAPRSS